jgi:hypothetical protein
LIAPPHVGIHPTMPQIAQRGLKQNEHESIG